MNETEQNGMAVQFDIRTLLIEALRRKFIIIGILVVSVVVSLLYTKLFCTPMYTAAAKVHILDNSSVEANSGEFTVSTYLTRDYTILVTERIVLDEVIKRLDLDMSYQQLRGCVMTNNPQNSRIIEIYAETEHTKLSSEISNAICTVSQEVMLDLMGSNRVNIVSSASTPRLPSSPNLGTNVLYGLLIGIVMSGLFVLFMYYKNDRISSAEDVQKYLGLCTLATIPYNSTKASDRHRTVKS